MESSMHNVPRSTTDSAVANRLASFHDPAYGRAANSAMNGFLNRDWLHKPVNLRLHVIQVGQGRPRFTFPEMAAIRLLGTNGI